jgi:hypothetical protein
VTGAAARAAYLVAALGLALGGCAVRPVTPALASYEPAGGYGWTARGALPGNDPETLPVFHRATYADLAGKPTPTAVVGATATRP